MIGNLVPGPREFAAYVYRIRFSLLVVALLFTLTLLAGAAIAVALPHETQQIMELVGAEFSGFRDQSSFELMFRLFLHNALICAIMVALGLAFGLITLLIVADNGLVIGLIGTYTAGKAGLLFTIAAIMPHGVIELPAMVLSAAIGLYLGYSVLQSLFRRPVDVVKELKDGASMFVFWVLPFLLIAAFIESYVTTAVVYFLTR
ncbi:MAG: stage II sporulation protein M [Chloroflexi bacterium]|nr:MAG: stage II sporulation protein M [Chloroflexota bacterium]